MTVRPPTAEGIGFRLYMKNFEVTILGSGTSMGVPMVGCDCRVCRSTDAHDRRLRTSALIDCGGLRILIDTSSDYRQQMLRAGVSGLDAVLYTHHHVDHILGLDDLRSFNLLHRCAIPIYGLPETLENIQRIFSYAFHPENADYALPRLELNPLDDSPFSIRGVEITPIPLKHGKMTVLGFRIGDFAYCTDVNFIPDESFTLLRNLKVLILDALRFKPHPTHFSVEEAIAAARKIGARETYFTHISHQIHHEETEAQLPEGIHLAYDGLKFSF